MSRSLSRVLVFAFASLLTVHLTLTVSALDAAEPAKNEVSPITEEAATGEVAAGHSFHGEAFNEGPRQGAVLMPGMANIVFPTSAKSDQTQKFFEQGIAQLHGFWYLEAERSFRQVAMDEPDLAIAYWGMAMANVNNDQRARDFIDQAKEKSKKNTSKRERQYIDALDRYLPPKAKEDSDEDKKPLTDEEKQKAKDATKRRGEKYIADLEAILHEFPDDIEAKAILAYQLWFGDRRGVKLTSRYAVEALLEDIFEQNPDHPAHHYRIHLWDSARPDNALVSAAKSGPSSPGIAHMWHMPGHIYSKLKRYGDAAWQQEASARVDHSHMIRTQLLPDQIHNFAHNNEWLVRNLIYIGRVDDAVALSKNLISLPRHPKYNSLDKRGSHRYGRQRMIDVLTKYGLWESLIEEMENGVLSEEPTESIARTEQTWLGVAQFMSGDTNAGGKTLREFQRERLELQGKLLDLADAASVETEKTDGDDQEAEKKKREDERKKIKQQLNDLKLPIARIASAAAAKRKDLNGLKKRYKEARLDAVMEAEWLAMAGDLSGGLRAAERGVKDGPKQVRPLAVLTSIQWKKGDKEAAKKSFEKLRTLASDADLKTPLLAALKPVAKASGIEAADWRETVDPATDLGERPPLDELGPFRWTPPMSSSWTVKSPDGEDFSSEALDGRPTVVVFYLGFGCLHCVEQLHALIPEYQAFRDAGMDVIAISTESIEDLSTGIKAFDEELPIPLFSDASESTEVFKTFRCWDDFESQPLHGTFLIDADGRIRWQDISYEPFMDTEFLLKEFTRLLQTKTD